MEPSSRWMALALTNLVEHLVALVEHEDAHTSQAQVLVPDEGLQTTRGADNDVRVRVLVLEDLGILGDGSTTVEDTRLDVGHVLAEAAVLVLDLEGQLTSVAHNQDGALSSDRLNLLQRGQDEHGRLSETGLGLADDVTSEEGLGDTGLLDCRYRSKVRHGSQEGQAEDVNGGDHRQGPPIIAA